MRKESGKMGEIDDWETTSGPMIRRQVPSLVDVCVRMAIDNLRYLGDVGETDAFLLQRILPHCTVDQLMHVEKCSVGRDLTPISDKLWKGFYEKKFGSNSTNLVIERMKQKKVAFRWKQLYEAKLKDVEEAQTKSFNRIKQLYEKEDARKQSRQIQICTKVPPASNKRSWAGMGACISNTKSNIMKKAKVEFLKSPEVKNAAAMKRNAVQRSHSISSLTKQTTSSSDSSASASNLLSLLLEDSRFLAEALEWISIFSQYNVSWKPLLALLFYSSGHMPSHILWWDCYLQ